MYNSRIFARSFGPISKDELDHTTKGEVVIKENDEVEKYEGTGISYSDEAIYLLKTKSFGRKALRMKVPWDVLDFSRLSVENGRNYSKENKAAGLSILGGLAPFTSIKFEQSVIEIPVKDDSKIFVFKIASDDKFVHKLQSLEETKQKKQTEEENEDDSEALEVLKKRLAKGEITEEEFQEKKELIE